MMSGKANDDTFFAHYRCIFYRDLYEDGYHDNVLLFHHRRMLHK
jgi:hypothetical protein